jgi:hypothetical protein
MRCDSCGQDAPLREAEFGLYIGVLIGHVQWKKQGRLCSACIHETFLVYTLVTLLLGWWSVISLFLTPIMVFLNVVSYCGTFLMRPYPVDPPIVFAPPEAVLEKLRPCRDEMFQRLLKGESLQEVSEDIARRVGASPEQVIRIYNSTWG